MDWHRPYPPFLSLSQKLQLNLPNVLTGVMYLADYRHSKAISRVKFKSTPFGKKQSGIMPTIIPYTDLRQ
jgi:hypothetical protein